jgi:hypothetical protein
LLPALRRAVGCGGKGDFAALAVDEDRVGVEVLVEEVLPVELFDCGGDGNGELEEASRLHRRHTEIRQWTVGRLFRVFSLWRHR